MLLNVPTTQVPNTQSFPDNAYPASSYYGINSTLANFDTFTASASAAGNGIAGSNTSLMPTQTHMPGLMVAFVIVIAAAFAWHFYYK
jgi:hypothetical protein